VVSRETVKQMLASESALSALYENALFLSDAEMQDFVQSETGDGFSKQVIKYVIDHSVFELESKVAVLRPDSEKRNISDFIGEGFPAQIISVNDNFLEDEKDAALLKIEENNLPSLSLGNGEELVVGKKAYIFGFPATAELSQGSSSEATFTQGIISAIKQSANKDFRIFQTDAKVSSGSSGGPLFDERGEVKGIITFQTDELSRAQGDNFAFALPIALVKAVAEEAGVIPREGSYSQNFKSGFQSFNLKRCDKAEEAFHSALDESNNKFVSEKYFDVYFKKCDELQKRGRLEILLNEWQNRARAIGNPFFYLVGIGLVIFGIFGALLFWILRQVQREEKEIEMLETRLRMDETRIKRYDSLPRSDIPLKKHEAIEKKSVRSGSLPDGRRGALGGKKIV
jgi:tetratricopeptide (TPR) repeat protein